MRKRQRTAAEASNKVVCSTFEAIMDKIAVAANSSRAISSSSTENDNSDFDRISEGLEDHIFEELDEKFVFLDKDISSSLNKTVSILTDRTKLPQRPLINACRSLLNKLTSCALSAKVMRSIIRTHGLQMEEPFDLALHNDLNFTEVMCTHL
ncbi:hypothetical protein CU097_004268 [Rhizopus azygosporus]|uniref:Uncharacterized protein n=1 Tax=Rhizopus azygosporus TaxID=86630 RepID=A0A367J7X3_RHIAZ|nr:hypothetical protein CU097_004268 [Rhizopus azygosporus]